VKKKYFITHAVLLCSLLFTLPVTASDADELAYQLKLLKTFSGGFQQNLVDDKGSLLQKSSGVFFLQRPGYFHWETKEPFPQLLISDLDSIWLYDPDLEQATVRQYDEKMTATPALLLSGDVSKINQHYQVEKKSDNNYLLTPKDPQELFVNLSVTFVDQQLSSMSLKDSLGQTTTFSFIDGIYNQEIPQDMFSFTPPAGTDVIVGN
jgi:outer membrane lipoprotein carrier protein